MPEFSHASVYVLGLSLIVCLVLSVFGSLYSLIENSEVRPLQRQAARVFLLAGTAILLDKIYAFLPQ